MRTKLLSALFALGALSASAPAADAQIVQVGFGRGGFRAALAYGYDYPAPRPLVRAHVGPVYSHGGSWQDVRRQVWVPGFTERVWQEEVWEYRTDACGRVIRVLVAPAGWRVVQHAGHYEWRTERVWVTSRGCSPYRY